MPGAVAELRATLSTAIAALDGWTLSAFAPSLFGRDTRSVLHHAFAIDIPESVAHPGERRQKPADQLLVTSTVDVLWAHSIRGDAQVSDQDRAFDAEQELVSAVLAVNVNAISVERLSRRAGPEGYVLGVARFSVLHRIPLA